ncbi:hypothetical protein Aple_022790 [Acrocarpospora pleiomorpha]|uniref:Integral membrane protein n=1 Tax=Acrocarpospora pleiomorpha TaxID=90975 RepID=A0A5M3XJT0_9ACTN|nr:hypothetical protein [Acrocarpospora pleiomorpha]GES19383.1 hypothetical protein Aple_022790 [Acrocarpospora pleiomorpha]
MTTPATARRAAEPVRRVAWGTFAAFLGAFAVFESVKYGLPTTAAAVASLAVPFAFRTNRVAQSAFLPLAVMIAYALFTPVAMPPVFTAGLGWLTGVAVLRAARRG